MKKRIIGLVLVLGLVCLVGCAKSETGPTLSATTPSYQIDIPAEGDAIQTEPTVVVGPTNPTEESHNVTPTPPDDFPEIDFFN